MKPIFFKDADAFREWLKKHHQSESELLVGYYKVGTGKPSMTWSESVDQALCFGWIDGVRKSIDAERYQIRFTPRRPDSIWSTVNIRKIKELQKKGLMMPRGIAAFKKRKEEKSEVYSYEKEPVTFSADVLKIFKANKQAWAFFQTLAPSYRKASEKWIMDAKLESTRMKRLETLITESSQNRNPFKDHKYK